MYKGTVKFYNNTKGFGFIVDSATGEEIFVQSTGLIDEIQEGDVVSTTRRVVKKAWLQ